MKTKQLGPEVQLSGFFALAILALAPTVSAAFYTDLNDVTNPPWATVRAGLPNDGTAFPGPVAGSTIDVDNPQVETGTYGNRTVGGSLRLHVPCNTSTTNLTGFSRWYQRDGKTQVFRLFANDQNTVGSRTGASRVEAFNTAAGWKYTDNRTYEWTGKFTIAKRSQANGFCILQVKNGTNDWSLQLFVKSDGSLIINQREKSAAEDPIAFSAVDGKSFQARILDDGKKYQVWLNGVLKASGSFDRPTDITRFRWGMYCGSSIMQAESVILVSGAQVTSVAGRLP